jgi:hypothetical protein
LCTLLRNAALATPFVSIPSPLFSIQRGVYPSQFGVAASTTLPPASSEAARGDSYLPSSLSTALFRAGIGRRYTLLGSMPIDTQDEAAYLSAPMRSRMRLS